MQSTCYSLLCQNCGRVRGVTHAWLCVNFPEGNIDATHVYSKKDLVKIARRLKCLSCGAKRAKLTEILPEKGKIHQREGPKYKPKYKDEEPGKMAQKRGSYEKRKRGTGLSEIRKLLQDDIAWLYGSEVSLLQSYKKQIEAGKGLTEKQRVTVKAIGKRVQKRKDAKFVRGGTPGLRNR